MARLLLISPYHSGSHKQWAEGFQKYSSHQVEILSLPGQLWKWRMHGAAVTLAKRFLEGDYRPDVVLTDDMLDLPTLIALTRSKLVNVPFVLYMHENQLLYPLSEDKSKGPMRRNMGLRERQYVLINWKSMLAADKIFFNSKYHLDTLFAELPAFLRHYQDHNEVETVEMLKQKSAVLPVGVEFKSPSMSSIQPKRGQPIILWNQRWEFDKNPAGFFATLRQFKSEGGSFRLIVCGEQFGKTADLFDAAEKEFSENIIHFGYANRKSYDNLLQQSDIVISTSNHEFFGISILEAVQAGAFPLLPNRLSYPELIPSQFHADVLYKGRPDLVHKLHRLSGNLQAYKHIQKELRKNAQTYSWSALIGQYDQEITAPIQIS